MLLYTQMLALGVAVALTPCPLATNIATLSYLSTQLPQPRRALLAGGLYAFGRILAYMLIGALVMTGLLSAPGIAHFLQEKLPIFIGPLMIVSGLLLLEYISLASLGLKLDSNKALALLQKSGYLGSLVLGLLFALSMCPVGASIFFGPVLASSTMQAPLESFLAISLFGFATALPVVLFCLLVIFSLRVARQALQFLLAKQQKMQLFTGWIFILIGVYLLSLEAF